jgi:uncharacterized membrane protein YdjX (TVP38/TMEM64 family)
MTTVSEQDSPSDANHTAIPSPEGQPVEAREPLEARGASKKDPKAPLWARIGIALVAALLMGVAYKTGLLHELREPQVFAEKIRALGAIGKIAFIVSYTLLQPFGVPGTVFILAAPLIWPWPTAFALSMTGTMGASVVGFSFARFLARDWIQDKVPAKFRKYQAHLDRNGFVTVALLRLVLWMPQMLHVFLGVSRVPFWTHFWGSVVGYLLPIFLVSRFGSVIITQTIAHPVMVFGGFGVLLAVITLVRRLRKRPEEPPKD